MLTQTTHDLISRLASVPWLIRLGQPDTGRDVTILPDWETAMKYCAHQSWVYVLMESRNALCSLIHGRDKEAFQDWSNRVKEVKVALGPMPRERLSDGAQRQSLDIPKPVFDTVEWCLLMACMELEYAALEPPRFYEATTDALLAGHLVCGWSGTYTEGRFAMM